VVIFNSSDAGIIAALIAAVASLVVAVMGFIGGRKNERDLEALRAKLAEGQAEKDARRDYEYEARKRLYHEFEPLLFQFVDLAESAQRRIGSIARTARQGHLEPGKGWLSRESYYLLATMYKLMAPLVIIRLMQQRLTLIDLTVDPKINVQYALMKRLYNSFTDDFDLADMEPVLEYDPNAVDQMTLTDPTPSKHYRQGMFIGRLDNAVDSLIVSKPEAPPRCMSFGEFEAAFGLNDSVLRRNFVVIVKLFSDMHPQKRPVFWRVLIVQAHLYRLLLAISRMPGMPKGIQVSTMLRIPDSERHIYDWRSPKDAAVDEAVLAEQFRIAELHLSEQLMVLFP
jgi:hypothetical protein